MRANRFFMLAIVAIIAPWALTFRARGDDDVAKKFDDANRLYDEAKYTDAEKLYASIVSGGRYSPELFYNLGNTEFRLEKSGAAILNYERAQSLSPGNPEIAANLAYVRGQTGARIAEKDWRDEAVMNFSTNNYTLLAAVAVWLAIFSMAAILFGMRSRAMVLALAALCCAAVAGYAVFAIWHLEKNDALAIVMAKSVEARHAPADNSTLAATLPLGSRVWILELRGPWAHCRLPDNTEAWISADAIERVRLQNS